MLGGLNKRYYGYGYCTTIDDNDSKSLCIAQMLSDCKIADMLAILECTMCFGVAFICMMFLVNSASNKSAEERLWARFKNTSKQ